MDLINFLLSYFASKNIIYVTAFLCWDKDALAQLYRNASVAGIRLVVSPFPRVAPGPRQPPLSPDGLDHLQGNVLDLACPGADEVIRKASETRSFNQRNAWLLLHDAPYNLTELEASMSNIAILPDADVILFTSDITVDFYRVTVHKPLQISELDISRNSSEQELAQFWLQRPSVVTRRRNLNNITVKAALVVTQPDSFVGWDDLTTKGIDTIPKVTYPLILLLAQDLNISFDFTQVQSYGDLVNGSFHNSAIGLLEQGRIEVAATSMLLRRDRMRMTHFVSESADLKFFRSNYLKTQVGSGLALVLLYGIDTIPKVTYPLILLLAQDLNISFDFTQVQSYGDLVNGSFHNSAIGLLEQGRIEVAATSMLLRRDRMRMTHFVSESADLKFFRPAFIFRQPPQSAVANIFLLPLSRGVWIASFIVFLLVAAFLSLFSRRLMGLDPSLEVITPGETLTFAVGAVCQQGFFMTPNLQSIRVMMFFTFITSLFLFTSYSAKIVALLQSPSNSILTVRDLAMSPLSCGVQDTSYKKTYYIDNPHPATKVLYERKLRAQGERAFSYTAEEGVARLRSGQFAFQVELSAGFDIISKTFTESEKCGLNYVDPFRLQAVGIPIKKHSGLKELVSNRLRWFRDTGLMDRVRRIWSVQKPRCDSASISGVVTVGLADCLPAFQVLMCGAAASGAILVMEVLVHKIKQRYKVKSTHFIN
ncbi:uncharacterized protein LOC105392960 [Plutella xylostella]|uniref:uncharacterized protein LOC105392960 n=1 Tax=Plutella xylostella TaxID=51655 RepID=UPI0020322650|nr:uncharacterized protein LOC105392960 [Plutella xylostella]